MDDATKIHPNTLFDAERAAHDSAYRQQLDDEDRKCDDTSEGIDWDEIIASTQDEFEAGIFDFDTRDYPTEEDANAALEAWVHGIFVEADMPGKPISPSSRPLKAATAADLASRFEKALVAGDGVAGAHCIHELWMRGEFPAHIEAALERLWERAAKTIPDWLPMRYVSWLPLAYEVAAQFQPKAKGRSNIYLILLDYSDRRGDSHGAYVGMSQYSPAARFDQHKAGIRAAGSALKRGIEVLTGPTLHLQHIKRSEAARIEVEFAEALKDAGLTVQGGH